MLECEESCQCQECIEARNEEKRLRRELARQKKKTKQAEEKNLQSKKEIEMIQHNYEVISRYFHAMVHSMRQAKIRDLRGAPGPREAGRQGARGAGRQGGRRQGGRDGGRDGPHHETLIYCITYFTTIMDSPSIISRFIPVCKIGDVRTHVRTKPLLI